MVGQLLYLSQQADHLRIVAPLSIFSFFVLT